jgi:hypothetical protein
MKEDGHAPVLVPISAALANWTDVLSSKAAEKLKETELLRWQ